MASMILSEVGPSLSDASMDIVRNTMETGRIAHKIIRRDIILAIIALLAGTVGMMISQYSFFTLGTVVACVPFIHLLRLR